MSSAIVVKKGGNGRHYWLVVKQSEGDGWSFPKVMVRRGESSARGAIRVMGELGGLSAKIIEEAGRIGGSMKIKDKVVPKRSLYYLMIMELGGEMLGFEDFVWKEYPQAVKILSSVKEKEMFLSAKKELGIWIKNHKDEIW